MPGEYAAHRVLGLGEIFTAAVTLTDLDACLAAYDEQLGRTACWTHRVCGCAVFGYGHAMRRHGEIPWRLTPQECDATCPSFSLSCCGRLRAALALAGSSSDRDVFGAASREQPCGHPVPRVAGRGGLCPHAAFRRPCRRRSRVLGRGRGHRRHTRFQSGPSRSTRTRAASTVISARFMRV